ncbi:unnamed protein product [Lota lota]
MVSGRFWTCVGRADLGAVARLRSLRGGSVLQLDLPLYQFTATNPVRGDPRPNPGNARGSPQRFPGGSPSRSVENAPMSG